MTLTEQLSDIVMRPVSASDRGRAARHVLDWIGCAALGVTTPPGEALACYGRGAPSGPCLAFGAGRRDAGVAALVNGGLGNILEMDDVHRLSILHPGDTAIPAALALAERESRSGPEMLDAVVRGYEAAIRVGSAAGPGHYRYWYNTATCGVFGAAAAAGSLLELERDQLVDAFGQAGMQASGLWQCRIEPTFSKQLAAGRAAQSGVLAAELAHIGFPGPHAILEGTHGFFRATCPNPVPDAVTEEPDGAWRIWETSFKPWAACRHAHPTIQASLELREMIDPADVRAFEVSSYEDAIAFCDRPDPADVTDAKFSLQHAVATVMSKGVPRIEDFHMDAVNDPAAMSLRGKVSVAAEPSFTDSYPRRLGASVTAVMRDGRQVTARVESAKGDPENPMTESDLDAKAQELLGAAGVSEPAIETVRELCLALPEARSVDLLTDALAAWQSSSMAAE